MNSIFQTSSQFGSPFSKFTSAGVTNEIYRTNSVNNIAVRNFDNQVNNRGATFSFHSVSANTTTNTLAEKTPDPYSVVDLLYKDDNSGNTSSNTGFFVGFKQGTLEYKDFNITEGLPNIVLDINVENVANGQVWVQNIDEVGQVQQNWTRVDRQFGASTIFNATSNNIRNIY